MPAPAVPVAEAKEALRWAVKDSIDFAAEEAILDSMPIPADATRVGRPAQLIAVAARRERVRAHMQAFQSAGVRLAAIDVAEVAQRNLAALYEQPDRGLAFLSFDEQRGLLTFTRNGELYALRYIDVGARALAASGDAVSHQVLRERITLELQRSLDNFDRQFSQVALQRLVIAPFAGRDALVADLQDMLSVRVEAADLDEAIDFEDSSAIAGETLQAPGGCPCSAWRCARKARNDAQHQPVRRLAQGAARPARSRPGAGDRRQCRGLHGARGRLGAWRGDAARAGRCRRLVGPPGAPGGAPGRGRIVGGEKTRRRGAERASPRPSARWCSTAPHCRCCAASPIDNEGGFAARLEALARQSVDGLWLTGMVLRQDDVVLKGRALQPQLIPVYVQRLDREPSLQGRAFRALEVVRPLEKPGRAASAAVDGDDSLQPSPPARTVFVEFTLSGVGAETRNADTEAKP